MSSHAQISATISATTKERLARFAEEFGLETNYVVEQALLLFMEARREVPKEAFTPMRLVLEDEAFDRVVKRLEAPPTPTSSLRELMRRPGA